MTGITAVNGLSHKLVSRGNLLFLEVAQTMNPSTLKRNRIASVRSGSVHRTAIARISGTPRDLAGGSSHGHGKIWQGRRNSRLRRGRQKAIW